MNYPRREDATNEELITTIIQIQGYLGRLGANVHNNYHETLNEVIERLESKWGAEEIEQKCHNCKHYTKGEFDGSCGSYICKEYSGWEDKTE